MRPPKSKWQNIQDLDMNPRKGIHRKKPTIRLYKDHTTIGQTVKAIELLSPTTAKTIFNYLVSIKRIQNTPKDLLTIRKYIARLQKHNTVIKDRSTLANNTNQQGNETIIILNPNASYKFNDL